MNKSNHNCNHNHNKPKETAKTLLIFEQIPNSQISNQTQLLAKTQNFPLLCRAFSNFCSFFDLTWDKVYWMLNYNLKPKTKFDSAKTFNEMTIVGYLFLLYKIYIIIIIIFGCIKICSKNSRQIEINSIELRRKMAEQCETTFNSQHKGFKQKQTEDRSTNTKLH